MSPTMLNEPNDNTPILQGLNCTKIGLITN